MKEEAKGTRGPGPSTKRAREAASGVLCLVADNPGPLTLDGTRTYVLGTSRVVVVDPGPVGEEQLERLREVVGDRPVEAVCLTHAHRDHAGCAAVAARALRAPVAASAGTLDRLGLEGTVLTDDDGLAVDGREKALRALEAPGHTADHLAYLWLPHRILFTGDLVLGTGTSVIVHPDGKVGDYLASLSRLISLQPRLILPGHGEPVREPIRRLEEYRRHRLERDRQVLEAVREGARSVGAIREEVYPGLDGPLVPAAELSIRAHLRHLREIGHRMPTVEDEELPPSTPEGEHAPRREGEKRSPAEG